VWGFIGPQLAGTGPSQAVCWVFPPYNPVKFVVWFLQTHSGNFFGYPCDFTTPGSAPSFALLVIGAAALWRAGRGRLSFLLVSPFVMTFIAAMLQRYPYADSPRVGQHLVGPICLLIGTGAAACLRWVARNDQNLRPIAIAVFILLMIIGLIAPTGLIFAPSREIGRDTTVRKFVRDSMAGIAPETAIAVLETPDKCDVLLRWYLHEGSHRIVWGVPLSQLPNVTTGPLFIASSPFELDGLRERIEQSMGAPSQRETHIAIPHEVSYQTLYYSKP
jgi:hypothetical protein